MLNVQLLSEESLNPVSQPALTAGDFVVVSDPTVGAKVTFAPQGTLILEQSLPVALVATAGTTVPLATIFNKAFGRDDPGFYSITLPVLKPPANTPTDHKYWCTPNVAPAWLNNGTPIQSAQTIDVSEIGPYALRAGNNIISPAQFQAQVTKALGGQGPRRSPTEFGPSIHPWQRAHPACRSRRTSSSLPRP
jgi:hypothetical protein